MGDDGCFEAYWAVGLGLYILSQQIKILWIIWTPCSPSSQELSVSGLLDEVDVLVSDAESVGEVNARFIRECHSWL